MVKTGTVVIHNMPEKHERFVVARLCDNELWFYGSWVSCTAAENAAKEIGENALVCEVE